MLKRITFPIIMKIALICLFLPWYFLCQEISAIVNAQQIIKADAD